MQDLTEALLGSSDFAGFLFNNLSTAIFLVDRNMRVQKVNDAYLALFSREESEAINQICGNALGCAFAVESNLECGATPACADCVLRNSVLACAASSGTETKTSYLSRIFYIAQNPVHKHLRIITRNFLWNAEPLTIIAIDDVTELETQKELIQDLANRDPLTNLFNRRYFFEGGETIFQNATRGSISIAVAMFDIDFFKRINDSRGHAAGDAVLRAVSDTLAKNLRKADILARFGGEEFCLLMHCHEPEDSYTVIDKLRLFVERQVIMFEGSQLTVTISAGLTTKLETSLEAMIARADEMLFLAKKNGRNRTEEYTG
jgi:diguanylate cyclase (GGDEF)-like protein